ncbi:MAG: transposase [Flavobacteriales bacterium]|nr:transposase [Flavobacteriales bacterium]
MQEAEAALETFAIGWEKRYPRVVESWRSNWPRLSSFLRYPEPIRRMMYTTNIIEVTTPNSARSPRPSASSMATRHCSSSYTWCSNASPTSNGPTPCSTGEPYT